VPRCRLASSFFGLTAEYKRDLQDRIFQMVYYTKGGYSWSEVYFDMPVYLRNYHYQKLVDALEAEAEAVKNAQSGGKKTFTPPPKAVKAAYEQAQLRNKSG